MSNFTRGFLGIACALFAAILPVLVALNVDGQKWRYLPLICILCGILLWFTYALWSDIGLGKLFPVQKLTPGRRYYTVSQFRQADGGKCWIGKVRDDEGRERWILFHAAPPYCFTLVVSDKQFGVVRDAALVRITSLVWDDESSTEVAPETTS